MDKLSFGKELVRIRKARGLTQAEVAEKCNLTTRTIQRIENGVVEPRAATIKIIAEFLEIDFFETSSQNSNFNSQKESWHIKKLFDLKTNTMKKVSILITTSLIAIYFLVTAFNKNNNIKGEYSKNDVTTKVKNETLSNDYVVVGKFGEIHKDWALVQKGNKFGFINRKGEIIVPIEYIAIGMFGEIHRDWALVQKGNEFGFINKSGKVVVPIEYNAIGMFGEIHRDWALVQKGSEFGFINKVGKVAVPIEYNAIGMFGEIRRDWALVQKGSEFGFINKVGKVVVPIEYSAIGMFGEIASDLTLVQKASRFGLMNFKGEEIISCKYESIQVKGSTAIVYINGETERIQIKR